MMFVDNKLFKGTILDIDINQILQIGIYNQIQF